MSRLFLIDIRWIFLLGVFYVIWSRPQEPAPATFSNAPLVEPTVPTPAPDGHMTIATAQPLGGGGGVHASYRGYQEPSFPSMSGYRKYADLQDDSQGDSSGNSLSQGATPVAGGVNGGPVIVDTVIYPYYYWGYWGYGRYYYRERFYGERFREGGTHWNIGSSRHSATPAPSFGSRTTPVANHTATSSSTQSTVRNYQRSSTPQRNYVQRSYGTGGAYHTH